MTVKMPLLRSFCALLLGHVRQQAEIVLLHRLLPATGLELALGAVAVQHEVGRRRIGQQRGDFLDALPHLAGSWPRSSPSAWRGRRRG